MLRPQDLEVAAVAGPLVIDVIDDFDRMAAMRSEWNALLEASDAGVFNAWAWLYPWARRIGADRQPFLLTARDERGTLVGLMPLGIENRRVLGRPVRRLAFLGETHVGSDYLDVIAIQGMEAIVAERFARALINHREQWDVIDLVDLREGSTTLSVFQRAFRHHVVQLKDRYLCPFDRLDPSAGFDAFLRKTGRRDNFLRRRKWLERQPGYACEIVESPDALAEPLEQFFRLHRLRWAEDGGSQGIKGAGVEAFHRDATRLLAEEGRLALYSLKVGRETVASVYGILHGGRFYYFQSGYDPAWRNKSVGLVLVGLTFEDALRRGLTEYDFLRGTESYKSDWTSQTRKTQSLRIHPRGGVGARLTWEEEGARRLRDAIKRILPEKATEWVRRRRRQRASLH